MPRGSYNGKAFTATPTISGTDNVRLRAWIGVDVTLSYYDYDVTNHTGCALSRRPQHVGRYRWWRARGARLHQRDGQHLFHDLAGHSRHLTPLRQQTYDGTTIPANPTYTALFTVSGDMVTG